MTNVPNLEKIDGKYFQVSNKMIVIAFMKCECDLTLNGCDE